LPFLKERYSSNEIESKYFLFNLFCIKPNDMRFYTNFVHAIVILLLSSSFSTLYAQVNADFSATPTNGCAPVFVQFTDLSTSSAGNIVSWSWDLSGGTTTSVQNPGKAFINGGQFTICLTVTDNQGNTDTECKTNYLNIFDSPQAQVTASATIGCSPFQVNFSNNSTAGSGAINLIQWAFGDGNSGSGTPISNTYTSAGDYDVTLSVSDANGCSDVITLQDYITVEDLGIVDFIANQTNNCSAPFTVNFSDLTNPNPNFTYLWDFGDGNTSTQQNPTHTYTTISNFNVSLTVTDNVTACSKTKIKNNYIKIENQVDFTYSPTSGCEPFDVNFTNTTPGNTSNWQWDFGDGFTSTQENPTHTFQTDGCFFVTLTLDRNGCTSSFISTNCIQINDAPQPTYTINGNNLACSIPHALSFTGTSNLVNSTFFWDFGDGNTSTQQNPAHTYITFGDFPVAFTAISSQGCSTTVVTDTVNVRPVNADFSIDTISGCTPLDVTFSDESFSLFPITSYNWNITGGPFSGTLTTQNPTITLTDTAVYDMTLTVTNSQGCSDNTTISSVVKVGMQPIVDFEAMDTVLCVDDDGIFTNLTSTFTDNYNWDFGDGNTSVATNPTNMYQDTGYFDVKLLAEHNGCVTELEKEGYIQIQPAKADYTINRDCNQPYTLAFLSTSIGADRFHWNFGVTTATNDTSDLENPVFTFPDRGTYVVTLTAFNDSTGCSHDYSETVIVSDPISNFSFVVDSSCAPMDINIVNTSTDASTYLWTVPGSTISDPTSGSPVITFENAGIYTEYELIITDVNNCQDTINFTDTIQVYDVYPDMSAMQLSCPDEVIQFTDISTTSDGIVTNWLWDFGNGQTSTMQNPSTIYTSQDTFPVSLTTTNSFGCTKTRNRNTFMRITQPNVDFSTLDTFVCGGQNVNFINNSDGKGRQIMSYLWDFGDGNTSTDTTPVHQYQNEGLFTVCLTVTDSSGCDSIYCITDLVEVVNPQSNFAADTTFASCPILVPIFSDSSTNAVSWNWNFGDGLGTSSQQNPTYTYVTSGNFDVQLVVTDINGCTDTLVKPSYINIDGPFGGFTPSTLTACPNVPVTFTGNGFNTTRYIWDFGDGNFVINQSSDTTNIHTYAYPNGGTYYPLLILEGTQGCIEVYPSFVPLIVDNVNAEISASDTTLCDTATINFSPTFISNLPIDSFYWSFDGVAPNSTDTFPSIFFSTPGIYTVELHVFNADCSNFGTLDILVGRNPQAIFAATPTLGCTPQLVTTQNSSTNTDSYPSDSIISWNWDWDYLGLGDTLENPNFTYIDSGDYNIQLIIGTVSGCFDTTSVPVRINLTPTASAGADKTMCLESAVRLDGSGFGTYQWSPAADLDDPTSATPIATPSQTTTYTLTVTSPEGCIDTDEVTVTVVQQIAAQVSTSNDTTICEGDVIQLFAFGGANVLQYSWDTAQKQCIM
jgi:PKD repeat protein